MISISPLRPSVVRTAYTPWDVQAFKQADSQFPHDSTLDQFFTDQKFEAYRILGRHAARSAIKAMNSPEVAPEPPDGQKDARVAVPT